jgi:hypothetical protein
MALAQVKEDRDDWRRVAEKLYACAKKLEEADEVQCASPEHRAWWRRLGGSWPPAPSPPLAPRR